MRGFFMFEQERLVNMPCIANYWNLDDGSRMVHGVILSHLRAQL